MLILKLFIRVEILFARNQAYIEIRFVYEFSSPLLCSFWKTTIMVEDHKPLAKFAEKQTNTLNPLVMLLVTSE